MVYFLQTEISERKPLGVSLQRVFGLGPAQALRTLKMFGIAKKTPIVHLSARLRGELSTFVEKQLTVTEDLKQSLALIKEQEERLKTYRGQRSRFKLPRRGQRTHTNGRTVKKFKKC